MWPFKYKCYIVNYRNQSVRFPVKLSYLPNKGDVIVIREDKFLIREVLHTVDNQHAFYVEKI